MAISIFDLYTLGPGPSSSHTVAPMRAARRFVASLEEQGLLSRCARVRAELLGSLGLTGAVHGSDRAIVLGLEGSAPETVDLDAVAGRIQRIREQGRVALLGGRSIRFSEREDLLYRPDEVPPAHPSALRFTAFNGIGQAIQERLYYTLPGGLSVTETAAAADRLVEDSTEVAYRYHSAEEMFSACRRAGLPLSGLVLANERSWRTEEEIRDELLGLWKAMQASVARGARGSGRLPGPAGCERRAPGLHASLIERSEVSLRDPSSVLDWISLYALAVAEENAAGGRVVAAPSNGVAGVLPAVLHYYERFCAGSSREGVLRFLLAAGGMGILLRGRAAVSGAEQGCQGIVGAAAAMAAAGLAEVLGGSLTAVEHAAALALEPHLGLSCDPQRGQVQQPCMERSAAAAVAAVHAARRAVQGVGPEARTLGEVLDGLRAHGAAMAAKPKALPGSRVAIHVAEC